MLTYMPPEARNVIGFVHDDISCAWVREMQPGDTRYQVGCKRSKRSYTHYDYATSESDALKLMHDLFYGSSEKAKYIV